MKQRKNRLQVERLAVLGAGASFAASRPLSAQGKVDSTAPLDNQFCLRIANYTCQRPAWANDLRDLITNGWCYPKPMTELGLETAILRQLGHLDFLSAIKPSKARNCPDPIEYLDWMTHLITLILAKSNENSRGLYAKIAGSMFKPNKGYDNPGNRIITFNYDMMFDKYLLKRSNLSARKIYFDSIKTRAGRLEENDQKEKYDNPLLLKLHGSVNWRTPTTEYRRILGDRPEDAGERIDPVWFEKTRATVSTTDEISPCIVPPLPNKPITEISLFKYLWTKAAEYLSTAKEIAIIGYSLPPTDNLAMSLFADFDNPRLSNVIVVDPNPQKLLDWQNLFRRSNVNWPKWEYHATFDDYCDSLN